jgi:hypothetical protein
MLVLVAAVTAIGVSGIALVPRPRADAARREERERGAR